MAEAATRMASWLSWRRPRFCLQLHFPYTVVRHFNNFTANNHCHDMIDRSSLLQLEKNTNKTFAQVRHPSLLIPCNLWFYEHYQNLRFDMRFIRIRIPLLSMHLFTHTYAHSYTHTHTHSLSLTHTHAHIHARARARTHKGVPWNAPRHRGTKQAGTLHEQNQLLPLINARMAKYWSLPHINKEWALSVNSSDILHPFTHPDLYTEEYRIRSV
jgi:hypothetical protein